MSEKRISQKQFYVASLIGGPLVAGFIAAYNFWASGHKSKAVLTMVFGLALNLLMEAFLILLVQGIFRPLGMNTGLLFTILLIGGGQLVFTILISFLLKFQNQKSVVFPANADYSGKWLFIPVTILSAAYLLIHMDMPMLFAPFPNMILCFYLIPHFYFFNRIKCISNSCLFVVICRWIIVFLACYMPLVFVLNDFLPKEMMDVPMFLAEYYIYTLLYIFLFSLGVDLTGKLILRFRILPATIIEHPVAKITGIMLVIAGVALILVSGNKRYNRIVVNSFDIQIPAGASKIKSLKICFVADMHFNNHTRRGFMNDFIKQVSQINPDIVLFGGDILERGRITKEKLAAFDQQLAAIRPPFGKFMVNGNHDFFRVNGYNKDADITFLHDTLVKVAGSFYLMGLSYRSLEEKPIAKIKALATENLPVFLLDHSPYQLNTASENHIDIQCSGHTHGGQVWPINYIIGILYDLSWGYKKIGNTHFFVTSGIQGWGTPIRTVAQSEIMVINVLFVN